MARMGWDTPTYSSDGKAYDDSQYGGYGNRTDPNGPKDANGNPVVLGTGASDAVNRYQGMGDAAARRGAYQVDFSQANGDRAMNGQDRMTQENALALQKNAAMGNAPSRAAIMGGQVGGQSLDAAMAAGAGARPGGIAAAAAQAQRGQSAMQLQGQMGAMAGRSNEMGQAIGGYGGAAGAIRQGDYNLMGLDQGQADAQAQSENAQRALNDKAQMADEGRAFNVNADELNRNLTQQQIYAQNYATASKNQQENANRTQGFVGATTSGFGSTLGAASGAGGGGDSGGGGDPGTTSDSRAKQSTYMLSDARAKQEAYDLGVARGLSAGPETRLGPTGITGVRANQNKPTEGRAAGGSYARQDPAAQHAEVQAREAALAYGQRNIAQGAMLGPVAGPVGPALTLGGAVAAHQATADQAPPPPAARPPQKGPAPHRRSKGLEGPPPGDLFDQDSIGPSGIENEDPPDYNFIKSKSPNDIAEAYAANGGKSPVTPATEAYMRREGMWSPGTDALLKQRGYTPSDMRLKQNSRTLSDAEAAKLSAKADGMFGGGQAQQQAQLAAPAVGSGLGARAARMQQELGAQQQAQLDAGPAVKPDMGQALEQGLKPYSYEYKPDFAQREGQGAGEKNVGPMAQDMASNPITGTAVKKGDDGMLYIDMPKVTKLNSAGIGYLAQKVREQGDELSRMKRGR